MATGGFVSIATATKKENYRYITELGGEHANPFRPGPVDIVDLKNGYRQSNIFGNSNQYRQDFHLLIELEGAYPPGAQGFGRMHKSADFRVPVRTRRDLIRCFGRMAYTVFEFYNMGRTIRGATDLKFNQAPVICAVSRVRSSEDPAKVIAYALHLHVHREHPDMEDADLKERSTNPALTKTEQQAARNKMAKNAVLRDPIKVLNEYICMNERAAVVGGGKHASSTAQADSAVSAGGPREYKATRSLAAPTDLEAASMMASLLDHPDRITRARYNAACAVYLTNAATENLGDYEERLNLPLTAAGCPNNPGDIFGLETFRAQVALIKGIADFCEEAVEIGPGHPDYDECWAAHIYEHKEEPAEGHVFVRNCWRSVDAAGTPVYPCKGADTWRVDPACFMPGQLELCYFPWVTRQQVSEETFAFKQLHRKYYMSICATNNVENPEVRNEVCWEKARAKTHLQLRPSLVNASGSDDLDAVRIECRRIMDDAKRETQHELDRLDSVMRHKADAAAAIELVELKKQLAELRDQGPLKEAILRNQGKAEQADQVHAEVAAEEKELEKKIAGVRPHYRSTAHVKARVIGKRFHGEAQKRAVAALARALHQDADMPDAVIAIIKFFDEWRAKSGAKNFSIKMRRLSSNLTWFGEMMAYWNASHDAFFNEYTSHKAATIVDIGLFANYLNREMSLLPVLWGEPGSGKSFIMKCAELRWLLNTWIEIQEQTDAAHRVQSNKTEHYMCEISEEMDPADVGAGMAAGTSKGMQDTAQTKRACQIRAEETSGSRSFKIKQQNQSTGAWDLHRVSMPIQKYKVAGTNMSPSMIPANSMDRKLPIPTPKRDKAGESMKDRVIHRMPKHLQPEKDKFIQWFGRNQGVFWLVGFMIHCEILKDIDSTVSDLVHNRLLNAAGDAGVQRTDNIRDIKRLKLVAETLCVLDRLTQLLDHPALARFEAEMDLPELLERLLWLDGCLVTTEEHAAFAWSLLDVQFEDPMLKHLLDGILMWRKNKDLDPEQVWDEKGTPVTYALKGLDGKEYKVLTENDYIDLSMTREERAKKAIELKEAMDFKEALFENEGKAAKKTKKSNGKAKAKAGKAKVRGEDGKLRTLEQEEEEEKKKKQQVDEDTSIFLQSEQVALADQIMEAPPELRAVQARHIAEAKKNPDDRKVASPQALKVAASEFVEIEWEEKEAKGRAHKLAALVYNFVPGKTKPSSEALIDAAFGLMRMVILLPNGMRTLAVTVVPKNQREPWKQTMLIARVLFETNVPDKTECFLKHELLSPFLPRQTYVFGYTHHDRPHLWKVWRSDLDGDSEDSAEQRIWMARHDKDVRRRRTDEDVILAGQYLVEEVQRLQQHKNETPDAYDAVVDSKLVDKLLKEQQYTELREKGLRDSRLRSKEDGAALAAIERTVLRIADFATIAALAPSDQALWRNPTYVDPETRSVVSRAVTESRVADRLADTAMYQDDRLYYVMDCPPEQLAITQRLLAVNWDMDNVRDLVPATAEELQQLADIKANEGEAKYLLARAELDDCRLEIALAWLFPMKRQSLFAGMHGSVGLLEYPKGFSIMDSAFESKQREEVKQPQNRVRFSTSSFLHAALRMIDKKKADQLPLASMHERNEDGFRRRADGLRAAGKRIDGLPLELKSRLDEKNRPRLYDSHERTANDILKSWDLGTAEVKSVVVPSSPARPRRGSQRASAPPSASKKRKSPAAAAAVGAAGAGSGSGSGSGSGEPPRKKPRLSLIDDEDLDLEMEPAASATAAAAAAAAAVRLPPAVISAEAKRQMDIFKKQASREAEIEKRRQAEGEKELRTINEKIKERQQLAEIARLKAEAEAADQDVPLHPADDGQRDDDFDDDEVVELADLGDEKKLRAKGVSRHLFQEDEDIALDKMTKGERKRYEARKKASSEYIDGEAVAADDGEAEAEDSNLVAEKVPKKKKQKKTSKKKKLQRIASDDEDGDVEMKVEAPAEDVEMKAADSEAVKKYLDKVLRKSTVKWWSNCLDAGVLAEGIDLPLSSQGQWPVGFRAADLYALYAAAITDPKDESVFERHLKDMLPISGDFVPSLDGCRRHFAAFKQSVILDAQREAAEEEAAAVGGKEAKED